MRNTRRGAALAAAALSIVAASSSARAAVIGSDTVSFSTRDQSLWAESVTRSKHFEYEVVDTGPLSRIIGSIGTVNIANPEFTQQFAACGALAPLLRQGCELNVLANVPLTIAVPDGAQAVLSGSVIAGFRGDISLAGNKANVDFSAQVDIEVSKPNAAPGELNFISLMSREAAGSIGTEFTTLSATIAAYMNESHSVSFDVFDRGDHVLDASHVQVSFPGEREILDLEIGSTTASVSAFGEAPETTDLATSYTKTVSAPFPGTHGVIQLPLGDVTVYNPTIDLDPPGNVLPPDLPEFPGTFLRNEKLPTERFNIGKLFEGDSGETAVDFARLEVDGNTWCLPCGKGSFTIQAPTPPLIPSPAGIEIRPANTDIGAFFGIGQTGYFEPNLLAHIVFSKPVLIEDPVLGQFSATTVTRGVNGSDLGFVMPEGDLDIDIFYSLEDNIFTDVLDLLISPARTSITLGVEIFGNLPLLSSINGEYALFTDTLPFGDPQNGGNLFTEETTLGGFQDQAGSRLSFRRRGQESDLFVHAPAGVPEPASFAIFILGLIGLSFATMRRMNQHQR